MHYQGFWQISIHQLGGGLFINCTENHPCKTLAPFHLSSFLDQLFWGSILLYLIWSVLISVIVLNITNFFSVSSSVHLNCTIIDPISLTSWSGEYIKFCALPKRHCLNIQSQAHRNDHHHHHYHLWRRHCQCTQEGSGSQVCRRRGRYVTLHFPPLYCFIGGIFYITFFSVLPLFNWSNFFLIFFFSSPTFFLFFFFFFLSFTFIVCLGAPFLCNSQCWTSYLTILTFCISCLNCEYKQIVSIERGGADLFPSLCNALKISHRYHISTWFLIFCRRKNQIFLHFLSPGGADLFTSLCT